VRRGIKPIVGTDIAAGVTAAASFLVMVFLLGMHLGLSALLAAGVYLGTWLITRQAGGTPDRASEAELLRQLDALCRTVPNPQVQRKIAQIDDGARRVLAFLEQHPEKADGWRGIVRECLESTLRIVRRYLELSRFFEDPSRQSLQEVEELLDQVAGTFTSLGKRLVDEGAADLSAEMDVFRSTLQAVNEVNVLNRGGGAP
jgi:5-bromo-4-chloroindolyl phosphate hydrolysis protein